MLRGLTASACAVAVAATGTGAVERHQVRDVGLPPRNGLTTAVFDPARFGSASPEKHFARAVVSGASAVRLSLYWPSVAPGADGGASFDPSDPEDGAYNWAAFDRQVRAASARGLTPIAMVSGAPVWAQTGTDPSSPTGVNPKEYGRFAAAAAARYSGSFDDLPRIQIWQAWNEPNITTFLRPQLVRGRPVAAQNYRALVNAFAANVKRIHKDNLVVAGGLAPFRDSSQAVVDQDEDWGPLSFMREVLCLSERLRPTCAARVRFDVWAMHPYTSGGPTHHAVLPNDVSLGDLPKVRATLRAAERMGHIIGESPTRFWVTEFSWDSSPPDPGAVPVSLLKRWVAHALYAMWRNGVSLVTWFTLVDEDPKGSFFQSGLYFRGGLPKPIRQAFRFPVVALPRGNQILVWGRTPRGTQRRIVIEHRTGRQWRRLVVIRSDLNGLFWRRVTARPIGSVRAQIVETGERSLPFGVAPVPDQIFNPFGTTPPLEPRG